jgi:hypothetical protein
MLPRSAVRDLPGSTLALLVCLPNCLRHVANWFCRPKCKIQNKFHHRPPQFAKCHGVGGGLATWLFWPLLLPLHGRVDRI